MAKNSLDVMQSAKLVMYLIENAETIKAAGVGWREIAKQASIQLAFTVIPDQTRYRAIGAGLKLVRDYVVQEKENGDKEKVIVDAIKHIYEKLHLKLSPEFNELFGEKEVVESVGETKSTEA